jgi:hypothetical protein
MVEQAQALMQWLIQQMQKVLGRPQSGAGGASGSGGTA